MTAVNTEIRDWLLSQQDWLQEAAERLLKQGSLTNDDLTAVTSLLKTKEGQTVANHRRFDGLVVGQSAASELMSNYFEWESLESLYLEDSFVLSISEKKDMITFYVEAVLTENHPFYKEPNEDEQYCYKRG